MVMYHCQTEREAMEFICCFLERSQKSYIIEKKNRQGIILFEIVDSKCLVVVKEEKV